MSAQAEPAPPETAAEPEATKAVAVAELEPTRLSDDGYLVGVGGWLALFVFGTVIGAPLYSIKEAIGAGGVGAGLIIVLGIFSLITGLAVARRPAKALSLVKAFLVTEISVGILLLALSVLLSTSVPVGGQTNEGLLVSGTDTIIAAVVWYAYFKRSRRVRNTLGANL